MDELIPGLYAWTAWRETIRRPVHSAYVQRRLLRTDHADRVRDDAGGELVAGAEALDLDRCVVEIPQARLVAEDRAAERLREARAVAQVVAVREHDPLGRPGRAAPAGEPVEPLVGKHRVDQRARLGDVALGPGALACADGVIRGEDGELAFVPDFLLGEDPDGVKRGLAAAYRRLAETLDFDVLLLAHGAPVTSGGRDALRAFAERRA
jgi:hypothetical protein